MIQALARAAALLPVLALTLGAQAQSSVTAYGLLDMSAGQFQSAGSLKTWRAESGGMSTSHLGFKGSEDLGGGVSANFAIEQYLRLDSGAAGRFDGDGFWARNAYVSLQGSFGQTRLGRNTTPLFTATRLFNPFGDSFGFSPSIRHYFAGAILGDSAWNNSVSFSVQNARGVNFNLMAGLGEGNGPGRNLGANMVFIDGPIGLGLAVQQVKNGLLATPAGFRKQDTWQLGGSYDLGAARLFAQIGDLQTVADTNAHVKLYQLGVTVPFELGRLLGSYGRARDTGPATTTRETLSLGFDYYLSKRTDVYGVLMNDKATGLSTGNTVAAGMRMRF